MILRSATRSFSGAPAASSSIGWQTILLAMAPALMALPVKAESSATATPPELGRWVTGSGNLEVEIAPCGDKLCGTVVKVLANHSMSKAGAEMVPADSRPALGMQILTGFSAGGSGERDGHIYNRENGKTYDCLMALQTPDALKIRPYVLMSWFGKTQIWHRVGSDLSQR
jgi:uncharacterized protein (DUF2147 family)